MLRVIVFLIFLYNWSFGFSQFNVTAFKEVMVDYHKEEYDFTQKTNKFKDAIDELPLKNETAKLHGIYLELFGKAEYFSFGYEYQKIRKKHSFGIGAGTSIISPANKRRRGYYMGASSFYDYGVRFGIRTELNLGGYIWPVMFTDKLDGFPPSDKPPKYKLLPSNSLGVFYRTKNNTMQISLSASLIYMLSRKNYSVNDNNSYHTVFKMQPWFGLTMKYNFKNSSQ